MSEKIRSKKVFFVSECLVNQNIRAYGVGNMKGEGPVNEIMETLLKHGCGFTVVPCPEIPYEGLKRFACGKERYDNPRYRKLCGPIVQTVVDRYKLYLDDGYKVGGFICVNGSPSCGVDFCHRDGVRCTEQGVFIEELLAKFKQERIDIPLIGFRAKELDSVCKKISEIAESL